MEFLIGQKSGGKGAAERGRAPVAPVTMPSPSGPAADGMIIDADQTTFMREVIDASRTMPVIVDFWATWCGPCKTLTPTLEKVVRSAGGRVKLVKIDIDKNQALVRQLAQLGLPLQSVPTVAAFWQGQIADLFQGALPESEVRRFVEALLKMGGGTMPGADLIAEAKAALEEGQAQDAVELFSAAVQQEPEKPEAWGGLARALLALGDDEQALQMLAEVPPAIAEHAEVSGARSAIALAAEGRRAQKQMKSLEKRLAANADDHEARYELATALNATNRRAAAADALLDIMKRDRAWRDDGARLQLLKLFEAWGMDDPATLAARRKLSAMLFR